MLAMTKIAILSLALLPNQTTVTAMPSFGKAWALVGMMMAHMEAARGLHLDPCREMILTNLWLRKARRSNVVLLHEHRWQKGLLLSQVGRVVDQFDWLQKMLELRSLWAWPLGMFHL